ncbi:hypothetical protein B0T18DRAFT_309819, partial [Schizothecium vesticola]
GLFSTDELKHKPSMSAVQRQVFSMVYPSAPDIVVGLSALDLIPTAQMHVGVTSFADKITASTADMHIQTTKGTLLSSAAATWFKAAPGSSGGDFQIGSADSGPSGGTLVVTFDRPYVEPPTVVVWLSGFEISSNPNNNNKNNNSRWRVSATAIDVNTRGFTLCFDTGSLPKGVTLATNPTSNSAAASIATASWMAFPKWRAGMAGGSFSTQDVAVDNQTVTAKSSWTGKAPVLSPEIFRGKPPSQVLVALNSLDIAVGDVLRVRVGAAAASSSEAVIGWAIESEGGDGVLYSAGASYVALA